jgi:hypothetical protein
MQQLSGLDTTFPNIETPTTYGHVSGLAIFDPSTSPNKMAMAEKKPAKKSSDVTNNKPAPTAGQVS